MRDTGYYVVQGWMVNRLKLKGNNLHVFAVIYGFSKDGKSVYNGGNKYLCDTVGAATVSYTHLTLPTIYSV